MGAIFKVFSLSDDVHSAGDAWRAMSMMAGRRGTVSTRTGTTVTLGVTPGNIAHDGADVVPQH